MRKKSEILIRTLSLLMTLLLISGTLACGIFSAGAATTTNRRQNQTYDIAVVFDNSGSMYKSKAWCRAKYAMEIFASMLDFSKDKLVIFPMWNVTEGVGEGGSYKGIEIKSKDDIDNKINKLYTPLPGNTPFAPVREANSYLKSSKAEEKWLIVMTDGGFNEDDRNKSADIALESELKAMANKNLKVQYLGFGGAVRLNGDESGYFYSKSSSESSLKDDLVDICNKMFQRIVLPANKLVGEKLTLDISMKRIIVFAQGSDATVSSLSSVKGDKVDELTDSGKRTFSEISAGGSYSGAEPDRTLAGQVVTFGECKAGEYVLDYSGADKIQIFYEPDIDIKVELINDDGVAVHPEKGDTIYEGEYTIKTSLIDSITGEDVTDSELLSVDYLETKYSVDGGEWQIYSRYGEDNNKKLNLEAGKTFDILIEGTYLKDYIITSEEDKNLEWLKLIIPEVEVIPFEVKAEVLQPDSYYYHKDKGDWEPIKVTFTLDGKPLTKEQLAATQFSLGFKEELQYTYEMNENESAIYVYIDGNRDKENMEPTGKYNFTVSATYINEKGKETTATDKVEFDIAKIAKVIIDFIKLLIALAILTLIALWLIHPVLPKRVIVSEGHFTKNATIKGSFKMPSRFDVRSVPVSGKAKVVPKMRNSWIMSLLKPKRMNFKVVDVNCSGISELTVDGVTYTAENGKLYDAAGDEVKSMIIGNSAVSWDENKGGLFEGTLNINKR